MLSATGRFFKVTAQTAVIRRLFEVWSIQYLRSNSAKLSFTRDFAITNNALTIVQ
jgi:hypothetical protein